MTALDKTINPSPDSPCPDCDTFLNWSEERFGSEHEGAVVFRSLIATVKLQPALDDSLEEKAVKLLELMTPDNAETADEVRLALLHADIFPQLLTTFNQLSLSFSEGVDIHINIMKTIRESIWLATPDGLSQLGIEDRNEKQAVRETVLKQVIAPLEKYIWHVCVNRYSIVDGDEYCGFMRLLAMLLRLSSSFQPTMDFVLNMPVFLTIPSCLTFSANDRSIWSFLSLLVDIQQEYNATRGGMREMGKIFLRMLRMEGIEDVIDEKLRNDKNDLRGKLSVFSSIEWNNLLGMNVPKQL
ncbi:hypothetical protein BLNAU_17985 [Blattamonas nauphoetae]|uniref:Uncharacterized protein n=1 Tax=Blattamonas nauphoetae TaxID=2049346 RepID=A0ABQ9X5R5_9EUKA|nr:hypothetical protein BLNAU_17985 [Blattamonas nauphoetae]